MKGLETKINYINDIKVICNYHMAEDKSKIEVRVFKILIDSSKE